MKKVIEAQRQIADLKKEGLGILDVIDAEKRAMTPDESKRCEEIESKVEELNKTIETRSKLLNIKDDVPSDDIVVKQPEKFRSIGEQLQAVMEWDTGRRQDNRLVEVRAATGMSEGIPADGGFAVQTDFASQLLEKTYTDSGLLSRLWRIPVSSNSNSIKIPTVNETSRVDGSRQGGIRAYWTGEAIASTKSQTKLSQVALELKKLTGYCALTEELLSDAPALSAWVTPAFQREFSFKISDALINGTGVGMPLGILNAGCLVEVTAETGQGAATLIADNVIKMYARRFGPNTGNYAWLINQDIEPQLHTMSLIIGSGGVPVYMPAGGWSGAQYGSLFGRPVIPCEQCATLGTVGDIILADLSQYIIAEKGGVQSASSIHVKFLEGETLFRFTYRCDGQPWWNAALTPYKGSSTQSPFVALSSSRT